MIKKGFTITELAFVLLIISLIIGVIFSSSSLVENSKMRVVISESANYKAAIKAFYSQYEAYPGDITNATTIWSTESTTNGNGNNFIDGYSTESIYAWQHLSLADLIPGGYSGAFGSRYVPGSNCPLSKLGMNSCWMLIDNSLASWSTSTMNGDRVAVGNIQIGGANNTAVADPAGYAVLTAAEAYSIDTKMDDGIPNSGVVFGDLYVTTDGAAFSNLCTTGTAYNVATKGLLCRIAWLF